MNENNIFLKLKSNKRQKQKQLNWRNQTRNKHNNSRTEATTLQLFVFFVKLLNCCSLLFNCCLLLKQSLTLGGAVREPWDTTVAGRFTAGGTFFSNRFRALTFSTTEQLCHQIDLHYGPKRKSFGSYFWEKCKNEKVCLDCAGMYGSHMSPSRGVLRATQQLKKKTRTFQNRIFDQINTRNTKNELQMVSKWVTLFRGRRLFGGSWDSLGAPSRFLPPKWTHNVPKVLPGTENDVQNDARSVKNTLKVALKVASVEISLSSLLQKRIKAQSKQSLEKTMTKCDDFIENNRNLKNMFSNRFQIGNFISGNFAWAPLVAPLAPQPFFIM